MQLSTEDPDHPKTEHNNSGGSKDQSENEASDPDAAWERLKTHQVFIEPLQCCRKKADDCTRFVCISDTHGKHRDVAFLPKGDVLIHAGDFTKCGETRAVLDLNEYFGEQEHTFKYILCIAGNHDLTFDEEFYTAATNRYGKSMMPFHPVQTKAALQNCIYLQDSGDSLRGADSNTANDIEVYGSPWTPSFCEWAFQLPRGRPLQQIWSKIPASTDVLITHGPPLGRGDRRSDVKTGKQTRFGCMDLLHQVQNRIKPRLHVYGHVHEGYGASFDGHTLFVNAATLNKLYKAVNRCFVIDLHNDKSKPAIIVQPYCPFKNENDFVSWLKGKNIYKSLVARIENLQQQHKSEQLITVSENALLQSCAFEDICNTLGFDLVRDKIPRQQLRDALVQLYAESF